MQNYRNNMIYQRDPHDPQSLINKATVKKQFLHPLIRFTQLHGKQNQYRRSNLMYYLIQNRQNLTGKNTIRKLNETYEDQSEEQYCANHPQRTAQFMVRIDQEMLTYCKKCATQVASQGFDVQKIVTSPIHNLTQPFRSSNNTTLNVSSEMLLPNISPSRQRQSLTQRNSRMINQKRTELMELANSLKQLKSEYRQKSSQLAQICQTFDTQKQTLTHYYSELISYIEQIRDSHIQAIEETSVNVIQVCEIQNGEISQTVAEIHQMVDDIEGNMEMILDQVDQQNYAQCYDFYKQKSGIFNHRLQELGSQAKSWPCTSEQEMLNKIHSFKEFINELHQVHDEEQFEEDQPQSFIY